MPALRATGDRTLTAPPGTNGLPRYSVSDLNAALGGLIERGFAPRFLLEATVSRPQLKKGHLWMTLVDEQASISAVVWASQRQKLTVEPAEGDGVVVVGKLNFWAARASLCVQVLDLRPSLSSVMRRFERVYGELVAEGLFEASRKRALPQAPGRIALLTSAPSSALADMLRTAAERWPATRVLVVPIPVQGAVEAQICGALQGLFSRCRSEGIEAVVLARGGGSREDLAVFDGAELARVLAQAPVPVVSGIGHEDDTTIADLVADYRAATPTAALVALLPEREAVRHGLQQTRRHLMQLVALRLQSERQQLGRFQERLRQLQPHDLLLQRRQSLEQARALLRALSPEQVLQRGFALIRSPDGQVVRSVAALQPEGLVSLVLADGQAEARVREIQPGPTRPSAES
ncbi:exodeoxyribonuclease VII large subunit [Cyanobium sp. NIES-981]|uniref:exodeoxyribonuclease VII large subunit n=1 Tax=Cyanobium sp. NIES-981 TaxID=1851505 RepID=UPI0007DDC5C6|nr:exodeoxyribonuclease VII large subunit [Cyanobium sp. NIES-981]SBO44774.1 Exodeoxyribonuclease 7 large subunit [Cyanobium sp. NIES-981]